jgi:precorrin-6B methylase 2
MALVAAVWIERQQAQDMVLGPILQAALERAQLRQGERVVDIGCGTGASSIRLLSALALPGRCWALTFQRRCWHALASGCRLGAPVKFVRARIV